MATNSERQMVNNRNG